MFALVVVGVAVPPAAAGLPGFPRGHAASGSLCRNIRISGLVGSVASVLVFVDHRPDPSYSLPGTRESDEAPLLPGMGRHAPGALFAH
ncbi:hypothetical protein GCM10009802_26340 [Streptomyces synnematoformans]|uniref:Secreted protein n=1 Tax=Streptomyces synnematoformans TaxID=415721 RepID=A0ABP5JWB5_9ACTN